MNILFGLDIVTHMNNWKVVLGEIRKLFDDVEGEVNKNQFLRFRELISIYLQGYRGLKSWKHHWDLQVYKAFEVAYVKGLHSIASKLPPIAVEIIYR